MRPTFDQFREMFPNATREMYEDATVVNWTLTDFSKWNAPTTLTKAEILRRMKVALENTKFKPPLESP